MNDYYIFVMNIVMVIYGHFNSVILKLKLPESKSIIVQGVELWILKFAET